MRSRTSSKTFFANRAFVQIVALNSGASLLHVVHNLFHTGLSCAVCAQILLSSSGKTLRAAFACETKFRLWPVVSCVRPFAKPKRACRASLVGAIRATCPSHLVYLRPTKTLSCLAPPTSPRTAR